jgi:hypothetical protein
LPQKTVGMNAGGIDVPLEESYNAEEANTLKY